MSVVLDNLWVLIAGVMVFLMLAGLAMFETGLTRTKNVASVMVRYLTAASVGLLVFVVVGYSFAYGPDGNDFYGWGLFALDGVDLFAAQPGSSSFSELLTSTDLFFESMLAALVISIALGALAERTKLVAQLLAALAIAAIIYPIAVHWTWGGGFIADLSIGDAVYSDFAGSTVINMLAGWLALVGAAMVGARQGKFGTDGTPRRIAASNMSFAIFGVFILWFGWFGLNGGSELAASELVMVVGVNTALAASAGGVAATAVRWVRAGHPEVESAGVGVLAGLVSITAGCAAVEPWGAAAIGAVGGSLAMLARSLVEQRFKIDDPVSAFAIHGVGGMWGALAVGLFARYDDGMLMRENAGVIYGGTLDQLLVQFVLVVNISGLAVGAGLLLFGLLRALRLLRVSSDKELAGLDLSEHGSPGMTLEGLVPSRRSGS